MTLTLSEFAHAKSLTVQFLRECGVEDGPHGVVFRHRTRDGAEARSHIRVSLEGKGRFRWGPGGADNIVPYGLWRLQRGPRVVIVEGETDSLALWLQDIPALGLPGVSMARKLKPEHIEGVETIFISNERGAPNKRGESAGDIFVDKLTKHLRSIGFAGDIFELKMPEGIKDPHALYAACGDSFAAEFERLMQAAPKVTEPQDARQRQKGDAMHAPHITSPPTEAAIAEAFAKAGETLETLIATLRSYVCAGDAQIGIAAFWALLSHSVPDAVDISGILYISSPEKRCGKSRLLKLLKLVVARPWAISGPSPAVIKRKINDQHSTMLLDESDATWQGSKEDGAALRGTLCDGFEREGMTSICVGPNHEPRDFSVYSAKAMAGIDTRIPDTIEDRCIHIRMRRRLQNESVAPLRRRKSAAEMTPLLDAFAVSAAIYNPRYREMLDVENRSDDTLARLESVNDRAADICEPYFVLADALGGEWGKTVRRWMSELFLGEEAEDLSDGVTLLVHVREAIGLVKESNPDADSMFSADLADALNKREEFPWATGHKDKPLTSAWLTKRLRPFGIKSKQIRIGSLTGRMGYRFADFEDAFERYIPKSLPRNGLRTSTSSTTHTVKRVAAKNEPLPTETCRGLNSSENPGIASAVEDVEILKADSAGEERYEYDRQAAAEEEREPSASATP